MQKPHKKHHEPAIAHPPVRRRLVARTKEERIEAISIGNNNRRFSDLYVKLVEVSWARLFMLITAVFLGINLLFTFLYLLTGGIENARSGSFADAFFFSVETLATIGYGKMSPVGLGANLAMTAEALNAYCFLAVITGLIFAKFSRPTARVVFSNVAIVHPYNGVPHLMLRLANARGNRIVDANIHLTLLRKETSKEGQVMRRFHDLALVRESLPLLQLTWTVMHPVDEKSPLYGFTPAMLQEADAEIIVTLSGLDESFSQIVHARYSYLPEEIEYNAEFEDIIRRTDDGKVEINYNLIDKTRPIA